MFLRNNPQAVISWAYSCYITSQVHKQTLCHWSANPTLPQITKLNINCRQQLKLQLQKLNSAAKFNALKLLAFFVCVCVCGFLWGWVGRGVWQKHIELRNQRVNNSIGKLNIEFGIFAIGWLNRNMPSQYFVLPFLFFFW